MSQRHAQPSEQDLRKLVLLLNDIRAFKDRRTSPDGKGFTLKSHSRKPGAPLSPFFLNLRTPDNPRPGPLTPKALDQIGEVLYQLVRENRFWSYHVAGIPNAGGPFAEAYIRAAAKREQIVSRIELVKEGEGDARRITNVVSGGWSPGESVMLFDDLVTEADTKLEAAAAIESAGLVVAGFIVLVDRQQGGMERLQAKG